MHTWFWQILLNCPLQALYQFTPSLTMQEHFCFPTSSPKECVSNSRLGNMINNECYLTVVKIHICLIMNKAGDFKNIFRGVLYFPSRERICHTSSRDWVALLQTCSFTSSSSPAFQNLTMAYGLSPGQGKVDLSDVQHWPAWLLKASCDILLFSFLPHLLANCSHQSDQCSQMLKVAEILPSVGPRINSESRAKPPKPACIWILRGQETFLEWKGHWDLGGPLLQQLVLS